MNEREFCYWLHGMFELTDADELTPDQVKMVKEHLKLVFTKVTPPLLQPPTLPQYPLFNPSEVYC